jgi:trk system potassium uptake protein TrkA
LHVVLKEGATGKEKAGLQSCLKPYAKAVVYEYGGYPEEEVRAYQMDLMKALDLDGLGLGITGGGVDGYHGQPVLSVIREDLPLVQALLENEGLTACDALVTMTGLDELNMVVSLYGTSRNIPQVITKLGHAENRNILDTLPIGSIVCPKELCCNNIIRYVRAMENQTGAAVSVHSIADGQAEAVEFLVDDGTENCGTALKDLKLKPDLLIASITHGARSEVPGGLSTFQAGDSVVVVTSGRGTLQQLNDIFA